MNLNVIKGNLFAVEFNPKTDRYAHCISRDMAFGQGIAVDFNQRYNISARLKEQFGQICPMGCVQVDEVYNLVTKGTYWSKPSYGTLLDALVTMRDVAVRDNVKRIVMPKIGTLRDKLNWRLVEDQIKMVFLNTDIEILVCDLR